MTVRLVPLRCPTCDEGLRPPVHEVVFGCGCGATLEIAQDGLVGRAVTSASDEGRPWWCVPATVSIPRRIARGLLLTGHSDADPLWAEPVRIWIPAFEPDLDLAARIGAAVTQGGETFEPSGPGATVSGCVLSADVALVLAELVVLSVEAERSDMLMELDVQIQADAPALWVLPSDVG